MKHLYLYSLRRYLYASLAPRNVWRQRAYQTEIRHVQLLPVKACSTTLLLKMRLTVLSFLLCLVTSINALHFYLDTNEKRCFIEELPTDTVVEGAYYVALNLSRSQY